MVNVVHISYESRPFHDFNKLRVLPWEFEGQPVQIAKLYDEREREEGLLSLLYLSHHKV
jgi:hypothetical protein